MESNQTAEYLYCLVPNDGSLEIRSASVVGDGGVRVVPCGRIGAVTSTIPASTFCSESAEQDLRDLGWLGPRVLRHEAVIEEAMRAGPVLPMRFGTMFRSTETLQAALVDHLDAVLAYFERVGDRVEWAVKGVLNRQEAIAHLAAIAEVPGVESTAPGVRYFQERRARLQAERDITALLRAFRERAAEALCKKASDFQERNLPADDGGQEVAIVLNWAFLLKPEELADWKGELERLQGVDGFPCLTLVQTGPFPPFSFAPRLTQDPE